MKETFPNINEQQSVPEKSFGIKDRIKTLLATGLVGFSALFGSQEAKSETAGLPAFETLKLISDSETGREHKDKFTIQVLESGSAKFIMQIGQLHYRPDIEKTRPDVALDIIKSQKEVEISLENLAKINSSSTNVFVEGYSELNELYLGDIKMLLREVDILSKQPDSNDQMSELIEAYIKGVNRPLTDYERVTFGYLGQKLLNKNGGGSSENQKDANTLQKYDLECNARFRTADYIYLVAGGAYKSFIDGKINIVPCEGINYTNPENHAELNKDESIRMRMGSTSDEAELKRLNDELSRIDRNKIDALVGDSREDQTLDEVIKKSGEQKIIPLVFGFIHDFSNNVKKLNAENPSKSVNLARYNAQ